MPFTVTDVQPTPNPNAAKFILDRPIVQQPTSFFNAEAAKGDAIASQLFAINGVTSVLMLGDFVTVNKKPEVKWNAITERVQEVLQKA
jgi:NFU1 iron-sulfur cluster scaffold homolog, mitochondrial